MPDTDRVPEQLGIQLYALFEKKKRCRQIRKPVLANIRTLHGGFFQLVFQGGAMGCWRFKGFFLLQLVLKISTHLLQ